MLVKARRVVSWNLAGLAIGFSAAKSRISAPFFLMSRAAASARKREDSNE
jgi:hypothetical protein